MIPVGSWKFYLLAGFYPFGRIKVDQTIQSKSVEVKLAGLAKVLKTPVNAYPQSLDMFGKFQLNS